MRNVKNIFRLKWFIIQKFMADNNLHFFKRSFFITAAVQHYIVQTYYFLVLWTTL